ncbi:MAG TPA: hypothetical protein VGE97_04145 [Nitrososphaera sp.]|jgi:hypothetical protein
MSKLVTIKAEFATNNHFLACHPSKVEFCYENGAPLTKNDAEKVNLITEYYVLKGTRPVFLPLEHTEPLIAEAWIDLSRWKIKDGKAYPMNKIITINEQVKLADRQVK